MIDFAKAAFDWIAQHFKPVSLSLATLIVIGIASKMDPAWLTATPLNGIVGVAATVVLAAGFLKVPGALAYLTAGSKLRSLGPLEKQMLLRFFTPEGELTEPGSFIVGREDGVVASLVEKGVLKTLRTRSTATWITASFTPPCAAYLRRKGRGALTPRAPSS